VSISEPTLKALIDAGERADDMVRHVGRRSRDMDPALTRSLGWFALGLALAVMAVANIRYARRLSAG
jgi:hypothetical protein